MQSAVKSTINKSLLALRVIALLVAGAIWTPSVYAGGIEELQSFIKQTRAARATFTQTVVDAQGVNIQDSSGVVDMSRSGIESTFNNQLGTSSLKPQAFQDSGGS